MAEKSGSRGGSYPQTDAEPDGLALPAVLYLEFPMKWMSIVVALAWLLSSCAAAEHGVVSTSESDANAANQLQAGGEDQGDLGGIEACDDETQLVGPDCQDADDWLKERLRRLSIPDADRYVNHEFTIGSTPLFLSEEVSISIISDGVEADSPATPMTALLVASVGHTVYPMKRFELVPGRYEHEGPVATLYGAAGDLVFMRVSEYGDRMYTSSVQMDGEDGYRTPVHHYYLYDKVRNRFADLGDDVLFEFSTYSMSYKEGAYSLSMQVDGELPVNYSFEVVDGLGEIVIDGFGHGYGGVRCLDSWNVLTEETKDGPYRFECFGFSELDAFQ